MIIPEGIKVTSEKPTELKIFGYNKQDLGQFAANLRSKDLLSHLKVRELSTQMSLSLEKKVRKNNRCNCGNKARELFERRKNALGILLGEVLVVILDLVFLGHQKIFMRLLMMVKGLHCFCLSLESDQNLVELILRAHQK